MKHSDSTEMDRLLRRHARRNDETLLAGREKSGDLLEANIGAHLDADELNAYAEGALPEAARSRYFAHLADCDTCRKLVTDLTLAAITTNESKARVAATPASPSRSWRDWFGAIFSPPVLRYGVPALALLAVIVVAIVALRTRREQSFVAQNDQATKNSLSPATANSTPATATSMNTSAENHSNSNTATVAEPNAPTPQPTVIAAATPLPAKTLPTDDKSAPPVLADKPAVGQTSTSNTSTGTFGEDNKRPAEVAAGAPAPTPPAQTKSGPGADERKRDSREESAKAAKEKDNTPTDATASGGVTQNMPSTNEYRIERGRTEARATQNSAAKRRPSAAPKSEAAKQESEEQPSAETRSVGGHSFRKQGNAWVDTAYNSSRSTINVPRGSEQYRALVADEPTLRTITQRLSGEVIVVWKSNAYRFY